MVVGKRSEEEVIALFKGSVSTVSTINCLTSGWPLHRAQREGEAAGN